MAAKPPPETLSDNNHPLVRGFHVLCSHRFVEFWGHLMVMNARGVKTAQMIFFAGIRLYQGSHPFPDMLEQPAARCEPIS
jgi:hypothetical protein